MILFIVESPTKIKTIKRHFKGSAFFCATFGHIKDLPKKTLGIDLSTFTPSFYLISSKKRLVNELKNLALRAKEVYLATDPDREGEAISHHLFEILSKTNPSLSFKRIELHEITPHGIKEALKNPRHLDFKLYESWLARRVLDRLIGYLISPRLSKWFKEPLSAGRVQSVALRLIVEREKEIEAFVPQITYGIVAELNTKPPVKVELFSGEKPYRVEKKDELTQLLRALRRKKVLQVLNILVKEEKEPPPPPFKTTTLIEFAQKFLKLPPKQTMFYAQRLYENGYITYMRTDSVRVSTRAVSQAHKLIKQAFGEKFVGKKRKYKKQKFAQEAHECIRPTDVFLEDVPMGSGERAVYQLIRLVFIASQMAECVWKKYTYVFSHEALDKDTSFKLVAKKLKFPGFRAILKEDVEELPGFEVGEEVEVKGFRTKVHKTKPPARYTPASLIKRLESLGIGRPSTYPVILDTLFKRGYIKKQRSSLYPTETGIKVCEFLTKWFPEFMDYGFTAQMETKLEEILENKASYENIVSEVFKVLQEDLQRLRGAS